MTPAILMYLLLIVAAALVYWVVWKYFEPWDHKVIVEYCLLPWAFLAVIGLGFSIVHAAYLIDVCVR